MKYLWSVCNSGLWMAKFKIGLFVHKSKYKSAFGKGYLPNFTEEYVKIKPNLIGYPIVYKLNDLKDEDLNGIFYEHILSVFNPSDETSYKKLRE